MTADERSTERKCPPHVAAQLPLRVPMSLVDACEEYRRGLSGEASELLVFDPNRVATVAVNVCVHCGALFIPVE